MNALLSVRRRTLKTTTYILAAVLGFMGFMGFMPSANAQELPANVRAKLLLRIISLNENIKNMSGRTINIGLLALTDDEDSQTSAAEMETALAALSSVTVEGRAFKVVRLEYAHPVELLSQLDLKEINVLYVTRGNHEYISGICEATASKGVMSITGTREHVEQCISVGLGLEGGKPRIFCNKSSIAAEKLAFSSYFFSLVKVLKE